MTKVTELAVVRSLNTSCHKDRFHCLQRGIHRVWLITFWLMWVEQRLCLVAFQPHPSVAFQLHPSVTLPTATIIIILESP